MTPEEHYAEAERLIGSTGGYPYGTPELGDILAEAQVHATLATVNR